MIFNPILVTNTIVSATTSDEWVRPADWIPIPTIATGEEVVYMLNAVYDNNSNFIAFLFQGNYTVDWGDGNIENVSSNVKAEHQYNYADCGNLSERGYKQALIKVTPQAGQHLTYINLEQSSVLGYRPQYLLDMILNIPNITDCGTKISLSPNNVIRKDLLERVWLHETGILTSCVSLFKNLGKLQNVPLFDTSSVIYFDSMFYNCVQIKKIPLFDTRSANSMSYMFIGCYSLNSVPLFDTTKVTSMALMFYGTSIIQIPEFNISLVSSMFQMCTSCSCLQKITLNVETNINMYAMLMYCFNLNEVVISGASYITDFSYLGYQNQSISKCLLYGMKISFSVADAKMSAEALNALGNSVADLSALPSAAVTVTGNFGAATMDTTIWTNKNWSIIN